MISLNISLDLSLTKANQVAVFVPLVIIFGWECFSFFSVAKTVIHFQMRYKPFQHKKFHDNPM